MPICHGYLPVYFTTKLSPYRVMNTSANLKPGWIRMVRQEMGQNMPWERLGSISRAQFCRQAGDTRSIGHRGRKGDGELAFRGSGFLPLGWG